MSKKKEAGETHYIIYGSDASLCMYERSIETLLASDKSDFDVVSCSPNTPITSLLDDFVTFERYLFIDAKSFKRLHENLRKKLHKIVAPDNGKPR